MLVRQPVALEGGSTILRLVVTQMTNDLHAENLVWSPEHLVDGLAVRPRRYLQADSPARMREPREVRGDDHLAAVAQRRAGARVGPDHEIQADGIGDCARRRDRGSRGSTLDPFPGGSRDAGSAGGVGAAPTQARPCQQHLASEVLRLVAGTLRASTSLHAGDSGVARLPEAYRLINRAAAHATPASRSVLPDR